MDSFQVPIGRPFLASKKQKQKQMPLLASQQHHVHLTSATAAQPLKQHKNSITTALLPPYRRIKK